MSDPLSQNDNPYRPAKHGTAAITTNRSLLIMIPVVLTVALGLFTLLGLGVTITGYRWGSLHFPWKGFAQLLLMLTSITFDWMAIRCWLRVRVALAAAYNLLGSFCVTVAWIWVYAHLLW